MILSMFQMSKVKSWSAKCFFYLNTFGDVLKKYVSSLGEIVFWTYVL